MLKACGQLMLLFVLGQLTGIIAMLSIPYGTPLCIVIGFMAGWFLMVPLSFELHEAREGN